jgi:urease accessory protein
MKKARTLSPDRARPCAHVVVLAFEHRQKHRFLATLEGGEDLGVHLPRGTVLADGDVLVTEDGTAVRVRAADEDLSVASTPDPLLLMRVAYHLGNRHVALQIEPGRVSYLHDHVLDDMARRLGAEVTFRRAPFVPEAGAYGNHGHRHAHPHDHDHDHDHDDHDHRHGSGRGGQ